jgi:hypothetical protein
VVRIEGRVRRSRTKNPTPISPAAPSPTASAPGLPNKASPFPAAAPSSPAPRNTASVRPQSPARPIGAATDSNPITGNSGRDAAPACMTGLPTASPRAAAGRGNAWPPEPGPHRPFRHPGGKGASPENPGPPDAMACIAKCNWMR